MCQLGGEVLFFYLNFIFSKQKRVTPKFKVEKKKVGIKLFKQKKKNIEINL